VGIDIKQNFTKSIENSTNPSPSQSIFQAKLKSPSKTDKIFTVSFPISQQKKRVFKSHQTTFQTVINTRKNPSRLRENFPHENHRNKYMEEKFHREKKTIELIETLVECIEFWSKLCANGKTFYYGISLPYIYFYDENFFLFSSWKMYRVTRTS
jgi:hypothetical protein